MSNSAHCEFYVKNYPNGDGSEYYTFVNIAEPQSCLYKKAINEPNIVISITPDVAKENIVLLDIDHSERSKYLPINVGIEFPNLSWYQAENRGVIEISKENFAGMKNMRFIDLDYNQITSLTQGIFVELPSLERIDLGKVLK